jgi:hypothetical protein
MNTALSNICDMSCEILRATNDGSRLAPKHLYLLQLVINGDASEYGMKEFEKLHEQVMAGTYSKDVVWHMGVEHVTKDHEGYIYYKGHHVEHFSHYNGRDELIATIQLAQTCELLESKGVELNTVTAVWKVEDYLTKQELEECEKVLEIDAAQLIGLNQFIKINTAPDVQPISESDIADLKRLGVGATAILGGGAVSIMRIDRVA